MRKRAAMIFRKLDASHDRMCVHVCTREARIRTLEIINTDSINDEVFH